MVARETQIPKIAIATRISIREKPPVFLTSLILFAPPQWAAGMDRKLSISNPEKYPSHIALTVYDDAFSAEMSAIR